MKAKRKAAPKKFHGIHRKTLVTTFFLLMLQPRAWNRFLKSTPPPLLSCELGKNCLEQLVYWAYVNGTTEAVAHRCSEKKLFLRISQNFQASTCARVSFLIKLQALGLNLNLLKKRVWHWYFSVNYARFLRTPFLLNTSGSCFWNGLMRKVPHENRGQGKYQFDHPWIEIKKGNGKTEELIRSLE